MKLTQTIEDLWWITFAPKHSSKVFRILALLLDSFLSIRNGLLWLGSPIIEIIKQATSILLKKLEKTYYKQQMSHRSYSDYYGHPTTREQRERQNSNSNNGKFRYIIS